MEGEKYHIVLHFAVLDESQRWEHEDLEPLRQERALLGVQLDKSSLHVLLGQYVQVLVDDLLHNNAPIDCSENKISKRNTYIRKQKKKELSVSCVLFTLP